MQIPKYKLSKLYVYATAASLLILLGYYYHRFLKYYDDSFTYKFNFPSFIIFIASAIPCFNEEKTIANVVRDFRLQLPDAEIYVFDNNSTDNTASEAIKSGAIVRYEKRQGKGNVVRSMFRKVDRDKSRESL